MEFVRYNLMPYVLSEYVYSGFRCSEKINYMYISFTDFFLKVSTLL